MNLNSKWIIYTTTVSNHNSIIETDQFGNLFRSKKHAIEYAKGLGGCSAHVIGVKSIDFVKS